MSTGLTASTTFHYGNYLANSRVDGGFHAGRLTPCISVVYTRHSWIGNLTRHKTRIVWVFSRTPVRDLDHSEM